MNEVRVRRLASEGNVDVTKKMLRRFCRMEMSITGWVKVLAQSELKEENVFAYPDFTFQMGIAKKERIGDLVCVQVSDGKSVRIVGYVDKRKKKSR